MLLSNSSDERTPIRAAGAEPSSRSSPTRVSTIRSNSKSFPLPRPAPSGHCASTEFSRRNPGAHKALLSLVASVVSPGSAVPREQIPPGSALPSYRVQPVELPVFVPDGQWFALMVEEPDGIGAWMADTTSDTDPVQVPGLRVGDVSCSASCCYPIQAMRGDPCPKCGPSCCYPKDVARRGRVQSVWSVTRRLLALSRAPAQVGQR